MIETTGMAQHEVTRTLVKSQPEVWTQCSDAGSLGRHMSGSFGEIRITRLEPEHSVAWEGEEVSGTVRIEPSAWGTRVTLTVEMADEVKTLEEAAAPPMEPAALAEKEPEPMAEPEPQPMPEPEPEPQAERGGAGSRWARFRSWWQRAASLEPPPEDELPAVEEPPPAVETPAAAEPEPPAAEPEPASGTDAAAVLTAALESLGQAHHRPFSRA